MSAQAAPDYLELSDYTGPLRRRWLTIVLLTALGIGLATGFLLLAPKQYTAVALVQVNALPNNANAVGGRTAGPVNMDNEGQVVRSGTVAAMVKAELHSPLSLLDITKNIGVTVPPNSTFLQVSYTAPSAAAARQWANAIARAYLHQRRVSTQAVLETGISALRAQATRLRATVEKLKLLVATNKHAAGGRAGSPVQVHDNLLLSDAQVALSSVQEHIDEAMPLYDSLAAPHSVIVGSIVTPATAPTSPSSPRALLVLPGGLALGLVLGLALAFVRDRRDKRMHSAADAERLAKVPTLLHLATWPSGRWPTIESPQTRAGQAFGELARHVSSTLGGGHHVLVVAATSRGPSGSVVAANVAAALARTTDETVLVCGDPDQTRLPELLGVGRDRGLSDALADRASVDEAARPVLGLPRLRLVTPGLEPAGAVSATRHAKSARFLTDLLDSARYVVIEVHSVGDGAGTFTLAEFGETAIVAVAVEQSRSGDLADCLERLDRLRTPVLGTVIVPVLTDRWSQVSGAADQRSEPGQAEPYYGQFDQLPTELAPPILAPVTRSADEADQVGASPDAAFNLLDFSGDSVPRRGGESWPPVFRVAGTELHGHPGHTDPAAGN